ncbi:myo-inositol transporter itr1 [Yamadazyma tenuis]|uniref:General substrate transporter n=1 Tax=Candida tenuis (strain ATCC 10573 / BCRC 21748 / CBS 615 / JCM 9827 / NBRC 10315 / NRRL Y-1498 / VKM Y-70) TaxID=590646 RepID=G3B0A9_CANTC|nr:general substrate transporter [Yamadazyma tenuis ATCC 10573]EGV65355.1 general substrate transporter [Yamadazyma tenuis ATCC 10573]WEJ94982.1 myo-inositol transporter itr1 [Yamadazyma tenuis]
MSKPSPDYQSTENLDLSSETSSQHLVKDNVSTTTDTSKTKPSRLVILLTLASSISGYMFGYDTGYISGALVSIGTDLSNKHLTDGEQEFITGATSLGALLGAVVGGVLANFLGRRMVLLGSNVIFVVGAIIQLAAKTVWTMIVGRFVLGWGVGIASLIAPLMISELAPSRYRGRLIVTNSMLITAGQLIAYFINWGLTRVNHGWRVSVGLCIVPAVLQFGLFWFLPDTPRFYIINNDPVNAKMVLKKVYKDADDAFIESEIAEMVASNSNVPGDGPVSRAWNSVKLLHSTPANLRALILACGLQGIQQFTGFNSLMYFSATIFETCGFNNATAVSIIVAATNFTFSCVSLCIIDHVGRRKTLCIAIPIMCIALVICAIGFHFLGVKFGSSDEVIVKSSGISGWGIVVILSMVLFVGSYAIGIGTSAWTGVELFSDVNVRSAGAMFAAGTNWAGSLTISSTFLTMLEKITPTGTFSFFAGLCVISFFFIYFLYPEVSGLELEETTRLLTDGFNVKEAGRLSKERKHRKPKTQPVV